jgi:hypothetical protein
VSPPEPDTAQLTAPDGAIAFAEPVTVAVKVNEPPRVGAPETLMMIEGVAGATVVDVAELVADTGL